MMRLPSWLFMRVVRWQFKGEICSFFHSHTGAFAPEMTEFAGGADHECLPPAVPRDAAGHGPVFLRTRRAGEHHGDLARRLSLRRGAPADARADDGGSVRGTATGFAAWTLMCSSPVAEAPACGGGGRGAARRAHAARRAAWIARRHGFGGARAFDLRALPAADRREPPVLANRGFAAEFARRLLAGGGATGPVRMGRVEVLLAAAGGVCAACAMRSCARRRIWRFGLHRRSSRRRRNR